MEEEGIGMVLARAMELRLKISNCVHRATATPIDLLANDSLARKQDGVGGDVGSGKGSSLDEDGEAEEDEESERLLNICDALESLETQLASLQGLQQQQRYEREAALSEIEHSRKMLLNKLKEYKGEDLEVIHEASAFAAETVEHSHDLMLPPYPTRPPHSVQLENGHLLHILSGRKSLRNGLISSYPSSEAKKEMNGPFTNHRQTESKKTRGGGIGSFVSAAAKTVVTIVGVVSILSFSGFGQEFAKRAISLKVMDVFKQPKNADIGGNSRCPPGKVLVVEDGEALCVVKERIEIPFSSVVANRMLTMDLADYFILPRFSVLENLSERSISVILSCLIDSQEKL